MTPKTVSSRQASSAAIQTLPQTSVIHYCWSLRKIAYRTLGKKKKKGKQKTQPKPPCIYIYTHTHIDVRGLLNLEKHLLPSGMPSFLSAKPTYTFGLGWSPDWDAKEMFI